MPSDCIMRWHEFVATRDLKQLDNLLSEDVVFYSPVVHTPQRGKLITAKYLAAAMEVLVKEAKASNASGRSPPGSAGHGDP